MSNTRLANQPKRQFITDISEQSMQTIVQCLAFSAVEHMNAADRMPCLAENTAEACRKREIAASEIDRLHEYFHIISLARS